MQLLTGLWPPIFYNGTVHFLKVQLNLTLLGMNRSNQYAMKVICLQNFFHKTIRTGTQFLQASKNYLNMSHFA